MTMTLPEPCNTGPTEEEALFAVARQWLTAGRTPSEFLATAELAIATTSSQSELALFDFGGTTSKRQIEVQLEAWFDQFWRAYPRRVAKPDAYAAFVKAMRRTTIRQLAEGLRRSVEMWADTEAKFLPYPATWLNRDGWLDEAPESMATGIIARARARAANGDG